MKKILRKYFNIRKKGAEGDGHKRKIVIADKCIRKLRKMCKQNPFFPGLRTSSTSISFVSCPQDLFPPILSSKSTCSSLLLSCKKRRAPNQRSGVEDSDLEHPAPQTLIERSVGVDWSHTNQIESLHCVLAIRVAEGRNSENPKSGSEAWELRRLESSTPRPNTHRFAD